jgi:hypothetical protein
MRRWRTVAACLAGVAVLGGGIAAYGYWTGITATGTGSATTGSDTGSLLITQTAVPTNLAPGVAPGAITGTIQDTGSTKTQVVSVTVSIASVTPVVGALTACTAADYILASPVMPVNLELVPNAAATPFSGATLGFNDTGADQDGCQGAVVNLAYASS